MLTARDLQGVIAITPTPAKEGADSWKLRDSVDLDETARLVDQLCKDGVNGLITTGTTGECATLLDHELVAFADCVVQSVRKRVPVFIGATNLGTRSTIDRVRSVMDVGADGTLLGLPMWQTPTVDIAVQFFVDVAEAVPEASILIYQNQSAFKFDFGPGFWRAIVSKVPNVIGAKDGDYGRLLPKLEATGGKVNFLPNDRNAYPFALLSQETTTACWSTAACMGPEPAIALMEAIRSKDMEQAKAVFEDMAWAGATFQPPGGLADFAKYNIQLEKLRMEQAGYCRPGPNRPPYQLPMPENIAEGARECGRRWVELRKKYAKVPAGS
jgi:dihydrodipicolinate synthase/N-acetylneuraminate lyase